MSENTTLADKFTDPDLEFSLLAAIAYEPERYWEIVDLVPPEALTQTQRGFEKIAAAVENQQSLPTVKEKPQEDILDIANKLADLYQKRLLATIGETFMHELNQGASPADLIGRLEYRLANALQAIPSRRSGHMTALCNLLPQALKKIETGKIAFDEDGSTKGVGLPTGLSRLDKLLGGLKPGVHLLVSEPGQGKTSLCLNVAMNVARKGYPAIYVSFDDLLYKLAIRTVCQASELEMKDFTEGNEQMVQLNLAAQKHGAELMGLHFLEGTSRLDMTQLKARALKAMRHAKARQILIVVDNIQLWAAGKHDFAELRSNMFALVSELHELAVRLESPILVVSTQNRSDQGAHNIRTACENGGLEHSADSVLYMTDAGKMRTAPPPLPAKAIDLFVEKNRYGETGRVELVLRPNIGHIREVSREKQS